MSLEVLVATMHQKDFSLIDKMNLSCKAVIANQSERWELEKKEKACMLSTTTRGVGMNRNFAIMLASEDILLFADDDMRYYDGALDEVKTAFEKNPDADVIVFGIDMTRNGQVFDRRRCSAKRLHLWNALKYGACRTAIRRASLEKANIRFSTLFGGGCIYGSGEDSLFIRDCFRHHLHVYSHPCVLGACAKDSSSWFSGFNEKFFFDKGAWIACAFPRSKHLVKWYFVFHFKKKAALSLQQIMAQINAGICSFNELKGYQ